VEVVDKIDDAKVVATENRDIALAEGVLSKVVDNEIAVVGQRG